MGNRQKKKKTTATAATTPFLSLSLRLNCHVCGSSVFYRDDLGGFVCFDCTFAICVDSQRSTVSGCPAGRHGTRMARGWRPGCMTTPRGFGTRKPARVNALRALSGHSKSVIYATFAPDRTRILTASQDTTAQRWDLPPSHECWTWARV